MELTEDQKLLEALSALEHEQWAHWTRYMLEVLEPLWGNETAPEEVIFAVIETAPTSGLPAQEGVNKAKQAVAALRRWRRQIETPYEELTETEKMSDREWAYRAFTIFAPYMMMKVGQSQQSSIQILEKIAKAHDLEAMAVEIDPANKPLKAAVLDLFEQFENPEQQDGDIQPQLDRLAELVGYRGPMRSAASKARGSLDQIGDLLNNIPAEAGNLDQLTEYIEKLKGGTSG